MLLQLRGSTGPNLDARKDPRAFALSLVPALFLLFLSFSPQVPLESFLLSTTTRGFLYGYPVLPYCTLCISSFSDCHPRLALLSSHITATFIFIFL